jgi:hypothetical protein
MLFIGAVTLFPVVNRDKLILEIISLFLSGNATTSASALENSSIFLFWKLYLFSYQEIQQRLHLLLRILLFFFLTETFNFFLTKMPENPN